MVDDCFGNDTPFAANSVLLFLQCICAEQGDRWDLFGCCNVWIQIL